MAGGAVPANQRGTQRSGYFHTADWYSTLASIASVDPTDYAAITAGLPPIDSLDCWPMLSGSNLTSPRTELVIGGMLPGPRGIIVGRYKLLLGQMTMAGWVGPAYPNASSADIHFGDLTLNCSSGCLFDIQTDPTEHIELSTSMPALVQDLTARLEVAERSAYSPDRGSPQRAACNRTRFHSHYGPFI